MKKVSNTQYAKALLEVAVDLKPKDLEKVIAGFVKILARDRKLKQANRIISEFERLSARVAGEVKIKIISARTLNEQNIDSIKKIFGDKVSSAEERDQNLLGGFKVITDDKIFDSSLQRQLLRLKQTLI